MSNHNRRFFPLGNLRSLFAADLAIDLGTSNTLIHLVGKGLVVNEPSVVLIRKNADFKGMPSVMAVGRQAKASMGLTPENLTCVRPMKDGVIADYPATQVMIKSLIHKAIGNGVLPLVRRIMISHPCGATQVERRIIREAAVAAGASQVHLVDEVVAAAIGAGLPVTERTGSMVVDIGGGTTEVGVVSSFGKVQGCSLRLGGDRFDELIMQYMRRAYSLMIDETTAEEVKKEIGSVCSGGEEREMLVHGRCMHEGLARSQAVTAEEVRQVLSRAVDEIVTAFRTCLASMPPKLITSVAQRGIVLTGGGALLRGLDCRLSEETRMKVSIADDPLTCVARGCGVLLDRMDDFAGMYQSE